MKQYRFFLEPWGWRDHHLGGRASNKHICPNCGKKTFVRYVDSETGSYLGDLVGKCDREDKCGYHYSPAMYFKDHPEAVRKDLSSPTAVKRPSLPLPTTSEISTIDWKYVESSRLQTSNFKDYLLERFRDCHPQVLQVCEDYFLGGDGDGGTIYWQIDELSRPHAGKIIQYDRQTGHRIKNTTLPVSWMHKKLIKAGELPKDWKLSQCLFGAHLLPQRTDDPVCLVESEKTALICAIRLPSSLWIATGGLNNFRLEPCQCLAGRNVIIYPDLGGYDKWCVLAEKFSAKIGFRYKVSRLLEDNATKEERQQGLDLADFLLRSG